MLYKVEWIIELDADTLREAAELARTIQQEPWNQASFYTITDMLSGTQTSIDLIDDLPE